MSRHARSARGSADPAHGHRAGRPTGSRAPRIWAALCGTALAAGIGGVLSGVLPLPSGGPAGLAAQDPAAAVPATDTVPVPAAPSAAASAPAAGAVSAAAIAAAAVPAGPVAARPAVRPAAAVRLAPAADPEVAEAQREILSLVNTRRARHGCGALSASAPLNQLAVSYSTEMGTEDFFSHTDPAGRTPWDRAKAMGISNLGGENIAVGQPTPQAVMDAWMNSSGHRANILDCGFHSLGVGVYYAEGGPWWTQDFGY